VALEVAGEAPTVADPGKRSLDDPAFGKHDEAMQFIALDDRQLPGAGQAERAGPGATSACRVRQCARIEENSAQPSGVLAHAALYRRA